jgi:hypothetical protein
LADVSPGRNRDHLGVDSYLIEDRPLTCVDCGRHLLGQFGLRERP